MFQEQNLHPWTMITELQPITNKPSRTSPQHMFHKCSKTNTQTLVQNREENKYQLRLATTSS